MRIIAGSLGGRTFRSPNGHRTHPMSDKVRGAVFNMLGDIEGLTVLDAFAGSGALSFEAISRGAAQAVAIDIDKTAASTIAGNAVELGISDRVKAVRANASSWSDNNPMKTFDLILLDPPYDKLQPALLSKLIRHLKEDGVMLVSWPGGVEMPELSGVELVTSKSYGDAQIIAYKKS